MGRIIKFEDFEMEDESGSGTAHNAIEPENATPSELTDIEPEEPELEDTELKDPELEENKLTDKAQEYVSKKIAKLKEEGYPDNQAAAIAFSMAKKRRFDVGENPNECGKCEDDEEVNEKKPRITSFNNYEMDENRDMTKPPSVIINRVERPLDAPYITDVISVYAEELRSDADTDEDYDIAVEMRQVGRSMKAQFPNNRDIHIDQVYSIADEQGIEDKEILRKVKEEIKYIWACS